MEDCAGLIELTSSSRSIFFASCMSLSAGIGNSCTTPSKSRYLEEMNEGPFRGQLRAGHISDTHRESNDYMAVHQTPPKFERVHCRKCTFFVPGKTAGWSYEHEIISKLTVAFERGGHEEFDRCSVKSMICNHEMSFHQLRKCSNFDLCQCEDKKCVIILDVAFAAAHLWACFDQTWSKTALLTFCAILRSEDWSVLLGSATTAEILSVRVACLLVTRGVLGRRPWCKGLVLVLGLARWQILLYVCRASDRSILKGSSTSKPCCPGRLFLRFVLSRRLL